MQRGDNGRGEPRREPTRLSPEMIGWLVAAVAAVVFIVQNNGRTRVRFLVLDRTMRVWTVIVIALVLGALLGWLLPRILRRSRRDG